MSNKFVLLSIFLITAVFISGCIDGSKPPVKTTGQDFIPTAGLPTGFTYMGTHDVGVDIGGGSVNATEGVYRNGGDDMYIQVIENENPGALIEQYKSDFKKKFRSDYNPFGEISFNGHTATKIADLTMGGQQETRYSIIWATEKSMVIVGSSADLQAVRTLATATGH